MRPQDFLDTIVEERITLQGVTPEDLKTKADLRTLASSSQVYVYVRVPKVREAAGAGAGAGAGAARDPRKGPHIEMVCPATWTDRDAKSFVERQFGAKVFRVSKNPSMRSYTTGRLVHCGN